MKRRSFKFKILNPEYFLNGGLDYEFTKITFFCFQRLVFYKLSKVDE